MNDRNSDKWINAQINDRCPKCNGIMHVICLTSLPPKYVRKCFQCGLEIEDERKKTDMEYTYPKCDDNESEAYKKFRENIKEFYSEKNQELIRRGVAKLSLVKLDADLDAKTVQRCIEAIDKCPFETGLQKVVHCVDCSHLGFKDFYGVCRIDGLDGIVGPNDYCSRGVKRDE